MTYEYAREKALKVAQSILEGDVGIIEDARLLSSFGHELVPDWRIDPDFVVLGALDSETDDLPVGAERKLWEEKALAERDAIVSRIEAEAKQEVQSACRNILRRFAAA
jgi:hypothetical protein